jgi:Pectate lyase superfamily protein
MPKSIPTSGTLNWAIPLNDHISQLQDPTNGAINSFSQFSGRPTNLTANDIGKTYLYTQTGNIHQWTGTTWKVLNESVVNVKDYGAIGDGVVDDTVAVQFCIDFEYPAGFGKHSIFFPQGRYRITDTLDMTNGGIDGNGKVRVGLHLKFEKTTSLSGQGTLFIGDTGSKPVIETTGSDCVFLENVGILSGNINESTIGILQARPAFPGGASFRNRLVNLFISLKSNLNANSGLGTIGFVNISCEEQLYENIEIHANTPIVISDTKTVKFTSKDLSIEKSHTFVSSFGVGIADFVSTTLLTFAGSTRLLSWDFISPIILIYSKYDGLTNNAFGGFSFVNLVMLKFLTSEFPSLAAGANSGVGNVANGAYDYAIECYSVNRMHMNAQMERCGRFMILKGNLNNCDILMICDGQSTGGFNNSTYPYILVDITKERIINHSKISLNTSTTTGQFIGSKNPSPALPLSIINSQFNLSRDQIDQNPYNKSLVQKGFFRKAFNTTFKIVDKEIKIGENSLITSVNKKLVPVNSTVVTKVLEIELPTIVANKASIGGSCEISGVCTSAGVGLQSQSSVYFRGRFSFVTQNTDGSIQLSPISLELDPVVNFSPAFNSITALGLTVSSANNIIRLNSQPTESGSNNIPVNIIADVKIHYSEAFLDNIIIDF